MIAVTFSLGRTARTARESRPPLKVTPIESTLWAISDPAARIRSTNSSTSPFSGESGSSGVKSTVSSMIGAKSLKLILIIDAGLNSVIPLRLVNGKLTLL